MRCVSHGRADADADADAAGVPAASVVAPAAMALAMMKAAVGGGGGGYGEDTEDADGEKEAVKENMSWYIAKENDTPDKTLNSLRTYAVQHATVPSPLNCWEQQMELATS